jgi:hypothetical protein
MERPRNSQYGGVLRHVLLEELELRFSVRRRSRATELHVGSTDHRTEVTRSRDTHRSVQRHCRSPVREPPFAESAADAVRGARGG